MTATIIELDQLEALDWDPPCEYPRCPDGNPAATDLVSMRCMEPDCPACHARIMLCPTCADLILRAFDLTADVGDIRCMCLENCRRSRFDWGIEPL